MMRANKNELYASLLLVLLSVLLSLGHIHMHPSPAERYYGALIGAGVLLFALLCAWHAILDIERMAWIEIIIAVPWFIALLLLACFWFAGIYSDL